MTAHREIELKRLLAGEDAGDKLIAALGGRIAGDAKQVNHFFDTEDRALRRGRHVLRLRQEGSAAFLTAKGPTRPVGRDTGIKTEAEVAIDRRLAADLLAGRVDPLHVLRSRLPDPAYERLWRAVERARAGRALRPAGAFQNRRRIVRARLPNGLPIAVEIDRTSFPDGGIDYEVEIELPSEDAMPEVEHWLDAVLQKAGVGTRKSSPKVARFYASQARARA